MKSLYEKIGDCRSLAELHRTISAIGYFSQTPECAAAAQQGRNEFPTIYQQYGQSRVTPYLYNLALRYPFANNEEFIRTVMKPFYRKMQHYSANYESIEKEFRKEFVNGATLADITGLDRWMIDIIADGSDYTGDRVFLTKYIKDDSIYRALATRLHFYTPKVKKEIKFVVNNIMSIEDLIEWLDSCDIHQGIWPNVALNILYEYYHIAKKKCLFFDPYGDSLKKNYDLALRQYFRRS